MTRLVVRLLGGFRVELDGEAVYDFETDKARGLLAYLAVEAGRPHRRESLASLLWPDRPDTVARANLRHALSSVRRALNDQGTLDAGPPDPQSPPFLFVTRSDVQFNTTSDYALDVAELEAFAGLPVPAQRGGVLAHGPGHRAQLLPEVFCADFLAGFAVPDSEAFQAWVLSKQEYFHRLAIEILDGQNAYFEGVGDFEKAVAAARLQLQLEPWLEEAHRRCMRGLALAGRRDEALHQYEACCRALETELGIEPAESTDALCADIRAGRLVPIAGRPGEFFASVAGAPSTEPRRLAAPGASPVPLVARSDELGRLSRYLDAAVKGQTGIAFVSGDAGSGKTALLEGLAASAMVEHPDLLVAGARCGPGGGLDAFAPLRRLAEMLFGDLANVAAWQVGEGDQLDRLQRATGLDLTALGQHGPGLIDVLVPASSVARRAGRAVGAPNPSAVLPQGALFDQVSCTLAAISREHPLLLLFDDLHWVDDGTAAFLVHLGRELSGTRLLVLGAYRSATVALGRRDPRSGEVVRHPLAATINELRRVKGEIVVELDRADGRAFVEAYVDIEPNRLGARFRDALYAHTGGHALFTVETFRNLQERGALAKDSAGRWIARESLDWGSLPARVEAAIAERIERLPEASRSILSAASVQGDSFAAEVVAELVRSSVPDVLACLSGALARQHQLVRPEGLQWLGSGQHSVYRFTHHLFQKYLYDELDPLERAQLHGGVAASLDRQVGGDQAERERLSARLAWHYEAGGLPLHAARALLGAGNQSMRVSAFREALDRFDHGLALLAGVPPSPERRQIERLLEVARLGPERNLEGVGSDGVQRALARAAEAWAPEGEVPRGGSAMGEAEERPKLLMLTAEVERLLVTAQFKDALAASDRLRDQAAQSGEEDLAGLAHLYSGVIHHYMGNPRESGDHFDRQLGWLTPERRARLAATIGVDVLADALAYSALDRWFLGYPEKALSLSNQAIAAARAEGAAVGQAAAMALGANLLFLLRGDDAAGPGSMAELSEQCSRLCLKHSIWMWGVFAEVMLARMMVMAGEHLAGIDRIRDAGWQGTSILVGTDFFVVVLADSCLVAAGRYPAEDKARERLVATGLSAIEGKLGAARIPSQQAYEAELHRLWGELLLARDGLAASEEALACFRRAIQLGREKGALAWELRAAMSVVRLRQRQGETRAAELAEARRCLAEVRGKFTEGFAFPDLRDTATLIGEPG